MEIKFPILGRIIYFNQFSAPETWSPNNDYMGVFFQSVAIYLNDVFKVQGYLSWETLCRTLGIVTNADEIEQVAVLRKEDCPNGFDLAREFDAHNHEWVLHMERRNDND